jgi:competence protein ComFC
MEERLMHSLRLPLRENFPVMVACHYEQRIQKALIAMKFYEAGHYGEAFGSILAIAVERSGRYFDGIIPVPLHRKRMQERGYNQARLIADKLSLKTGIPVMNQCLVRRLDTARQSETTSRAQRVDNLAGAFQCNRPESIAGKRILLLDDVLTSGATLYNAASALRGAVRSDHSSICPNRPTCDVDITGIVLASDR